VLYRWCVFRWPVPASGGARLMTGRGSRLARRADPTFPRITAHDLRHTAASLAISAGANPKVVQRMLGHASAAMTLDVYADLFDDDLTGVAEKLDEIVGKMWARGL
jgi:integrase